MSGESMTEQTIDPALRTIEDVEAELAAAFPPERPQAAYRPPRGATWAFWTDLDTADRGIPDEWVWERLRLRRDALLAASDFRMVPDAPWDTTPWAAYRQALRDMTTAPDPRRVAWPTPPASEGNPA